MIDTVKIDLPLVLPDLPDARDACVRRLIERLEARPGIERVHVTDARPPELCVHYDAGTLALARIERLVLQTGVEIGERYGHVTWAISGSDDQRKARALVERLRRVPGVLDAAANAGGPLRIEFDRRIVDETVLRQHVDRSAVGHIAAASTSALSNSAVGTVENAACDHERETPGHEGHAHAEGKHAHDKVGTGGHDHAAHGGIFGARRRP